MATSNNIRRSRSSSDLSKISPPGPAQSQPAVKPVPAPAATPTSAKSIAAPVTAKTLPPTIITATPVSEATVRNMELQKTVKLKLYVTTTLQGGKSAKFLVNADVPESLAKEPGAAEEFWQAKLQYLADHEPDQLPAVQESHKMIVDEEGLEVIKGSRSSKVTLPEIQHSCHEYVIGSAKNLQEALKTEKTFLASFKVESAPSGPPQALKNINNSCYLDTTIWGLLRDEGGAKYK